MKTQKQPLVALLPKGAVSAALLNVQNNATEQTLSQTAKELQVQWSKTDDGVVIFYRVVPDWLQAKTVPPSLSVSLDQLLTSLSPAAGELFDTKGQVVLADLNDEQKRSLSNVLLSGEINPQVQTATEQAMNTQGAVLQTRLRAHLYIYNDDFLQGDIVFGNTPEPEFRTIQLDGAEPQPPISDWLKVPKLIVPRVQLSDETVAKTVMFKADKETWTLQELAGELTRQTGVAFLVDKKLQATQLFVSRGVWKLPALIRAVSIAAGSEVRGVGAAYFFAPSPAHEAIFATSGGVRQMVEAQNNLLQKFSPRFSSEKAQKSILPFQPQQFSDPAPVSIASLTEEQKQFVRNKLPEALRSEPVQIRFVIEVWLTLFSGETPITESFGTPLTASSPYEPLKKAAGVRQSYDPQQFLQLYGAHIEVSAQP